MEVDSTMDAVDEETLPGQETEDESCKFDFIEITPLTRCTEDLPTTASDDWCPDVKQEISAVVKQEPDDVCCIIYIL